MSIQNRISLRPSLKPKQSILHGTNKPQTITPNEAVLLIETAEKAHFTNRRIDQRTIRRYANAMKEGRWNGYTSVISIDEQGVVSNGYHRLYASIECDLPFESIIVTVPDAKEAFTTTDIGITRKGADSLHVEGFLYTSETSTAIRMLAVASRNKFNNPFVSNLPIENDEILELANINKNYVNLAVEACKHTSVKRCIGIGKLMYVHLIAEDKDLITEFCYQLAHGTKTNGEGLPASWPSFLLRERLLSNRVALHANRPKDRLTQLQEIWLVIRAYTAFRDGAPLKQLRLPTPNTKNKRSLQEVYKLPSSI